MPSKRATEMATGGDFAASTAERGVGGRGKPSSSAGSTTVYAPREEKEKASPFCSRAKPRLGACDDAARAFAACAFSAATRATARAIAEHVRRILPLGSSRRALAAASSAAETNSGSVPGEEPEASSAFFFRSTPSFVGRRDDASSASSANALFFRATATRSTDGDVNKPFGRVASSSSSSSSWAWASFPFAASTKRPSTEEKKSPSPASVGGARRAYGFPGAVQSPASRLSSSSATTSGSSTSRTNASACRRNRGHARSTIKFKSTRCRVATAAAAAKRRSSRARATAGSTRNRGATVSKLPRGIWSTTSTPPGGAATIRAPASMRRVRLSMPRSASAGRIAARIETCMRSFCRDKTRASRESRSIENPRVPPAAAANALLLFSADSTLEKSTPKTSFVAASGSTFSDVSPKTSASSTTRSSSAFVAYTSLASGRDAEGDAEGDSADHARHRAAYADADASAASAYGASFEKKGSPSPMSPKCAANERTSRATTRSPQRRTPRASRPASVGGAPRVAGGRATSATHARGSDAEGQLVSTADNVGSPCASSAAEANRDVGA